MKFKKILCLKENRYKKKPGRIRNEAEAVVKISSLEIKKKQHKRQSECLSRKKN